MAKAFLSHSSKDKVIVEKIADQLGRNNCHYDRYTFEAGERTIDEIFKGLDNTDIFVLFISEWVQKEVTYAKTLLDKEIIDRIFPIIIDAGIKYSDTRIPDWIKKPYNIQYFDNEVLILKKIKQLIREANLKKYAHLKDKEDLFVGRYKLLEEFDRKVFNIDSIPPSCLTAHSFMEGMGRRTFLKNALVKAHIVDKWYEPSYLPLSSKESIEDFIYKLNFIESTDEIFKYDFSDESVENKILIAKKLVKKFVDSGELIFIIDDGGIILPNTHIVPWFQELMKFEELQNQVNICLVSKFRPNPVQLRKMGNMASFQIDELSAPEIQTLFIQYLQLLDITLAREDLKEFLSHLHGRPGQIIYAANMISNYGVEGVKQNINEINEYEEVSVLTVMDFLKEDLLSKQILIALSKFEIISYDIVYKIFGENEEVYKSIQKLFDLSLFYNVSSTHQYLKLNSSVADYLNRSKLELSGDYDDKMKEIIQTSLSKPLELNANSDYSEFLLTLQQLIRSGQKVPKKFLLPSFFLKAIVQEYYDRNYKTVIELSRKILEHDEKFDRQIIRETKYWLCLAYCRKTNNKFFEEVQFFRQDNEPNNLKDYFFLIGFYYRNADDMDGAEEYFLKVLDIDKDHSRTKRELVNVYLRKRNFERALDLAEDNYENNKSNILHINAYFTCLIKKQFLNEQEVEILHELLDRTKKSMDKRAADFYNTMVSEYDYYIKRNPNEAIARLRRALNNNDHDYHAYKALSEIYRRSEKYFELNELQKDYPHLVEEDD